MKVKFFKFYMANAYIFKFSFLLFINISLWELLPIASSDLVSVFAKAVVCFVLPDLLFGWLLQFRENWVDKVYSKVTGTWKERALPHRQYMVRMFWKWNINDFINWRIDHGYTLDLSKYPSSNMEDFPIIFSNL